MDSQWRFHLRRCCGSLIKYCWLFDKDVVVHWWKYDLLTEMLWCTDGNMTYWQRCCGCTSHGMKGRKAKWQNPLYPKICHRLPCPLVPPSFSLILRVTLSKSGHWREKFIVILFTLLFPFLCPKQKTKSLSIALLALYKRRNCSHRSFKQSKSLLAVFTKGATITIRS